MNKKLQEMWDSAHEIPFGSFVPEGTLLVRLDPPDRLYHYELPSSTYWSSSSESAPVRSVDPLPDPNDTGSLTVFPSARNSVHFDTDDGGCYDLSMTQARNLVRKITEAIDED